MNETRFTAPWSRLLIGVSAGATVLLLGVAATSWKVSGPTHIVPLGMVALLLGSALFTIRGYSVTPDAILVHRLFWSTRIPRAGLVSATVDDAAFGWSTLRTCGNGGLYSFTGWFWNKRLGRFRAWVTDPKRAVVLRYENRTAVVSPGDPEGFVRAVSNPENF